ncbi:UDP-4-amino-4,6-dideoxy-N-acetyl-beta-L-altrosamine transaminase [uncultured Erythrobacter sp.]|uniref:UDP-4-amino-4, 6-dideoxy-N-acetyl-beta-L-altrosamine transaminase n=1 Tax=uncultured Erythrobacter sp. TaxID=263913 RepID=UPI0026266FA2|nr:UDP-4-amino-4,6-dideoxy-N-acetyl-beta-L-altrosamine transaminase [uncultured Erythrobacter sp.]
MQKVASLDTLPAGETDPGNSHIPYSRQQIGAADIAAVTDVLTSDYLTQGPAGPAFETAFAARHAVAHAVAVSNATAALHIGCMALGIGPGSRVWTSPISFVASANCALFCGAQVDFVDIDPATRNMSVEALRAKLELAEAKGTLPDLLIPVDFAGFPCDLAEMRSLADLYGFRILQDASHATGAEYRGSPVGSHYADACVFSFHAVKIVTAAEGGMIVTQDDALAERLRLLRSHGVTRDPDVMERPDEGAWHYEQTALGYNYRLTDLQAALGLSQLRQMDEWRSARAELAARYDRLFADAPLRLPAQQPDRKSAWHLYAVEIDAERAPPRKAVFDAMRAANIGVNVHYIPIHTQPYYARLGFSQGDFPAAEAYYARALSLPLFPALSAQQQDRVADTLLKLVE